MTSASSQSTNPDKAGDDDRPHLTFVIDATSRVVLGSVVRRTREGPAPAG